MQSINTILNWISTSLMLPVVVLLLAGMIYSLLMLGGFCAIYLRLLQERGKLQKIMNDICGADGLILDKLGNGSFARKVRELDALGWDDLRCEKQITDYESKFAQELESAKLLMKFGPMLGLMGTLIPMGPALAGLAQGDIGSMAYNMQIAFSTTVVGIVIALIGTMVYAVKRHWYMDEISSLRFILDMQLRRREGE